MQTQETSAPAPIGSGADASAWPALPYESWRESAATLHLMTQIVGKIRLTHTAPLNHSWHSTLKVAPRGLTTGVMFHRETAFEICLDLLDSRLVVETSEGAAASVALAARPIAEFYAELMSRLDEMGLALKINETPNELPDPIRFSADHRPAAYDPQAARRFHRALLSIDRALEIFRGAFVGKCSPAHFFWGSFDLAVTRFSGRRAPLHPGGAPHLPLAVTRDAYSHEVSSAGFWPGGGGIDYPAFYSYAYPAPHGYAAAPIEPEGAFFSDTLQEFILPYDCVRKAASPDAALMRFLQSSYVAAADLGGWDRAALERQDPSAGWRAPD